MFRKICKKLLILILDLCALTGWGTIFFIVRRNEGWASYIAHNVGLVGKLCGEYIRARAGSWDKLTDTIIVSKLEIGVWI
jgi:hypothetical protein